MVYQLCSLVTTYRNVISTVTYVMEFTEECLTVFWTYVHALLCVFYVTWHLGHDHIDLLYKRIHFQSDNLPRELAICTIICI